MKRVLVLNHFAAPPTQAGGTRHVELFSRLPGWEAIIIAANRNALSRNIVADQGQLYRTVPTTPVSGSSATRILNWVSYAVAAFFRGLRLGRFDVVYGSTPHLLAPIPAWAIARLRHAAFVLEVRDLWPQILSEMGGMSRNSIVYRLLERLELFLYRRADMIVVMAKGVETELIERGFGNKIVYIPNGADPDDMRAPAPTTELRQRFGFTKCTGVYAGAHGMANGLDLLIRAMAQLTPETELEVVLVGDGPEKPRLIELARALRPGTFRFLDPIPKTEIPALLGAADFGLHVLADVELFRYGVSPNKLFDYMAAGLPVLTNTGGEVARMVREAGAGVAVEPTELEIGLREIAQATPEQLASWGSHGREYMQDNQSRTAMAARLADLLEKVSARHRR